MWADVIVEVDASGSILVTRTDRSSSWSMELEFDLPARKERRAAGDDAARTGLATGLALTFVCLRRLPRRFAVVMPARVHRHGHHITNMRV